MRSLSLAVFFSILLSLSIRPTAVEAQIVPVSQSRFVSACTVGGCSNFTAIAFEDFNHTVSVTTNFAGFSGNAQAGQASEIRSSFIQGGGTALAGGQQAAGGNATASCSVTFQISSNLIYTLAVSLSLNRSLNNMTGPPGVVLSGPTGTIFTVNSSSTNFTQVGWLTPGQYTISGGAGAVGASGGGSTACSFTFTVIPPPLVTAIASQSNDVLLTWTAFPGATNIVQVASGAVDGSYSNNFSDFSPSIVMGSSGITNYLDLGGATNLPARYYRIRMPVD